MNTAALDALFDHAADVGSRVPTAEDRGPALGALRWRVFAEIRNPADASKRRVVAGYGATREDAARDACDQLGVRVGFVVLPA